MGKCLVCGAKGALISGQLGVCLQCLREKTDQALEVTGRRHAESRAAFGLPAVPPRDAGGLRCGVCANDCVIGVGKGGFCGLVWNVDGRLVRYGGTAEKGVLQWYYDRLPTNCVNWWFCPGCTGKGYPKYAYGPKAEYGFYNLAVFYGACSYDCLYCQNWHYRKLATKHETTMTAEALTAKAHERVSCICYFGGDPSPQMPHSLEVARLAMKKAEEEERLMRICWETNGYMNQKLAEKAAEIALKSGGNMKFDLKTWNESLNVGLCGVSNKPTLENFARIGKYVEKRRDLTLLSASTLLVPGYMDVEEVENIANFISSVSAEIPYTLLAFYPCYVMNDLPTTSRERALECQKAAEKHLREVRLGNIHLLS